MTTHFGNLEFYADELLGILGATSALKIAKDRQLGGIVRVLERKIGELKS